MEIPSQAWFTVRKAAEVLGCESTNHVYKLINSGTFGPKERLRVPGRVRTLAIPHDVLDAVANGRPLPEDAGVAPVQTGAQA